MRGGAIVVVGLLVVVVTVLSWDKDDVVFELAKCSFEGKARSDDDDEDDDDDDDDDIPPRRPPPKEGVNASQ